MPGNIISDSARRQFVYLIATASFMGTLDATIVNISLPTISEYFNTSIAMVSWVPMAYMVTLASVLITCGKIADLYGYKRIYLIGFSIFTLSSLFCAVSPSIEFLIFCRVLQAAGAAMLQAIGGAMIAIYLPEKIRGWALGMLSTFAAIGITLGPVLGGFLTEYLSWQWIFLVNIPVGIIAVICGRRLIPNDEKRTGRIAFDGVGAALIFISLSSLIFAISMGRVFGYTSSTILECLIFFVGSATLLLIHEIRTVNPLVNLSLFKNGDYLMETLGLLCVFIIYNGVSFLLPFYLERGRGLSTDISGLYLMIPAVALMSMATLAGRISDKKGSKILCITSGICFILAMVLLSFLKSDSGLIQLIVTFLLFGCAVGLFTAPNFRLLMSHAPSGQEGVVSSVAMTTRNIGSALGVAIFASIFVYESGLSSGTATSSAAARDAGFHGAFMAGCLVACLVLGFSLFIHEKKIKPA